MLSISFKKTIEGLFVGMLFTFLIFLFFNAQSASAAITEVGPPMLEFHENITAGGGSIIPLSKFILQGDGSTLLTKVGVILRASSTMTVLEQLNGLALYRESGGKPHFQPNEDIYMSGTFLLNPAISTLHTLQPTGSGYIVPSSNTEFYVVASTTGISNIVNGNAFEVVMQTNYASTSAGALGTALVPGNKITLRKNVPVKISEVKIGSTGNDRDEFIELYNPNPYYIDIQASGLALHTFAATSVATNRSLTFNPMRKIMPKYGFFLIASAYNYSGTEPADATFDNSGANFLVADGGLSIATSTSAASATSTAIDKIGWEGQPVGNCENLATAGTACVNTTPDFLENGTSIERLANTGSTAATMAMGGADQFKGNGLDADDNSAEFALQTVPKPQNTFNAEEFPFGGGGGGDISAPFVNGSYPSTGSTGIPIDLSFIGFGFNEPVESGTIGSAGAATTTVTLVRSGILPSGSNNLCASVSYNQNPTNYEPAVKCNLSASLLANTSYIFEVGTTTGSGIRDMTGNVLDQNSYQPGNQSYQATFTTSATSQTMTNNTPPQITGSTPYMGAFGIPSNITKFFITFSQTMDATTLSDTTIKFYSGSFSTRVAVSLSGATFAYNASTSVLTISGFPSLVANTHYELEIDGNDGGGDNTGVKSSNSIMMQSPGYVIAFDTGSSDSTAPQVLGLMPVLPNQTDVPLNNISFTVIFNDHIDASTATSGAVSLAIQGGAAVPADVSYDSASKELALTARNLLPAGQNMLLTVKGASIKNISNTLLGTDYIMPFSTEGSNSDSAVPSITIVNADEFGIAITFSEAVNSSDATNLSNYSVVYTPSGGSQQTLSLSAMAGHTITYNASRRTAKITGIYLPPNASFTATASNIRDISANTMITSSGSGTTLSSSSSGGFIDPGMPGGMTGSFQGGSTFTMGGGGGGFMPPAKIMAMNSFVSASSTYGFEIPVSTRVPANGQIVLTFPSTSDFGVCCAATSSASMTMMNDMNRDINGPGVGTIGIKTIAKDIIAKTITLTLDTATRSENSDTHDFLKFMLTNIKNPSIAKGPDSSGYSVDIKTKSSDGSTVLESSFSVNPVYIGGGAIGGGATTTVRGQILSGYGGGVGLNGVSVMLSSSILGQMPQSITTAQSGGTHGYYEFTNLPANNDYFLFTAPTVSPTNGNGTATTTGYFGFTEPSPIRATSTSIIHKNLTLTATTSAVSLTIKLTASANTFTAGEQVDVFAGGSSQFSTQTATLGVGAYTAATITTLSLPQQNGSWFVGLGPMMPKDGSMMGPPPSVNWAMPKPLDLDMTGCPDACVLTYNGTQKTTHTFTISSADKTISGIVKDASGTVIANTMVYAYSPSQMMGNNTQSDTSGKFSLNIVQGQYNVGAFFPGMGQSKEMSVEVVSGSGASTVYYIDGSKTASTGQTGANPFIITVKRPSYKITGKVSDGLSSIANAAVFTYRTDGPGHADAMTDSSGNYTLYVDNGTWKVNARVPGYGSMVEQTITISGADQSNINFAPSGATTYWTITGTVFESSDATIDSGEGISNTRVMARNSSGMFETKTGSDGVYTLRVAEGNNYTLEAFKPGYGRIPSVNESLTAIAAFNVTGTTTKNIRVNTRQNVTINIKDISGNALSVSKAYIDLYDISKNFGNYAEIINGTTTIVQLPNGASTTVRVFIPSVPQNSITIASDNGANTLVLNDSNNNPVLQVNGAEIIKVVVNTNLRTISGVVYHTSAVSGNELKDVWIDVVETTSGMHYGVSATSTTGAYNINLADGSYTISAMKSGYTMSPSSITVSGNATQNLVMTVANLTISGTVTAGGSVAPSAFVRAEKVGGGSAITQADASGAYSLSVSSGTWRVYAASDKYTEGAYASNPLTVSASQTGVNITLSTAANIQSKLATSETFKDTSSGTFEDTTVNVKVSVDSGGLGQAGSDSYLTAKETVNYPDTSSVNVIANKAKDISAYSGGSQVKNLSSGKKATVELSYTVAELATSGIDTPAEVSKLQVSTVNEQRDWEGLETVVTYEDSSGNAVSVATTSSSIPASVASVTFTTTQATHFSPYALTEANNAQAPGTPSGVTATAASAGTASITLSWTANPVSDNVTGYYIYRDTASNPNSPLLTNTANTTYTDSNLSFGTTYYYRVAAYRNTLESAASSEASAAPVVAQGGGNPAATSGGGGSAPVIPPQTVSTQAVTTPTAKEKTLKEKELPLSIKAKPSLRAISVSPVFSRLLKLGLISPDVKRLQQILNSDADTVVALKGVGSKGKETTKFGPATEKALQKFQEKYKIAKKGDTGYGIFGPATRAKIKELFQKDEVSKKEVVKTKTKIKTKAKTTLKAKTKVKTKTKVKIKIKTKSKTEQKSEIEQKLKELRDQLKTTY